MPLSNESIKGLFKGDHVELDPAKIRDIAPQVLGEDGRLRVLPASFWAGTTVKERVLFGHRHGLYSFPTVELVERLRQIIDGRLAIEIGAGHGVLAEALDIPGTDSLQQLMPKYRFIYEASKQPIVPYGPNIVAMHASQAVRHYEPDVVIGCWITQKYDPARPNAGGNEVGVDMADVLRHCRQLVLIGNEKTHDSNPLWSRSHDIEYPDYLYSRSSNGQREFMATWTGSAR